MAEIITVTNQKGGVWKTTLPETQRMKNTHVMDIKH